MDTPAGKAIAWSEPEILLHDDDLTVRMSYPDFVEDAGRYFITETQKTIARVHEVPSEFLEMLWNQHTAKIVARKGLVVDGGAEIARSARQLRLPRLPDLGSTKDKEGGGFTVEFAVKLESTEGGQTLVDARDANGNGFAVSTTDRGTVQLALRGALGPSSTGSFSTDVRDFGLGEISWDCDPGLLKAGEWHHFGIIVDGGPKTISFVVDGKLNDGGDRRQFGWARFPRELRTINATDRVTIAPRIRGEMRQIRIYDRALRTSELVGNWRAGIAEK